MIRRAVPLFLLAVALLLGSYVERVGSGVYALAHALPSVQLKTPAVPQHVVPVPVGSHPTGDQPWFLVVGDSISAGISPEDIGHARNMSYVAGVYATLARSGYAWTPDDISCPTVTTQTYYSGCHLAFTNPLLGGHSQSTVAMRDIAAHLPSLKFILVELGSNDLFALQRDPTKKMDAQLLEVTVRLGKIVQQLMSAAPHVPVFIANFYDPYAAESPSYVEEVTYLNGAVAELAASTGATVVDFAAAMGTDRPITSARLCALIACTSHDIHPTVAGETRLAQAVLMSLKSAGLVRSDVGNVLPANEWKD
ncbi:MAG: SGNH/GDSL hydrolase family protein [Candidatus Dormibacteria bacterium]